MPTIKLTKSAVNGLRPEQKRTFWFDSDLKGFGLKIEPSGVKTWIVEYRARSGGRAAAKKRITLGRLGALTPDQARDLAKTTLVKVHFGEDPAAQKAEAKSAKTVADLCDLYLAEAGEGRVISKRGVAKKASTLVSDRGRIARHIKPLLGKKAVRDVTKGDIERFLRDVASGKTAVDVKTKKHGRAIVTGGKGTATRTVRLLGGIFSFAIQHGMRSDNPTHGVAKYADQQGRRFLSTEEMERLGSALRDSETIGLPWGSNANLEGMKRHPKNEADRRTLVGPHAAAAIRLLILTGCRLREILNLEWRHVDVERGLILLPDSKNGAKTIVLSEPAMDVFQGIPQIDGCPFVIVGEHLQKPRTDLKRPWATLTRAAKLDGVRIHDLRHTFASFGAGASLGLPIIGKLLGHSHATTTQRYAHLQADQMRRAVNTIGSTLTSAMNGKSEANTERLTR